MICTCSHPANIHHLAPDAPSVLRSHLEDTRIPDIIAFNYEINLFPSSEKSSRRLTSQDSAAALPISGACPGTALLGLRMNWHWLSGGRHWSSSRTPGQSVGLVGSLTAPPPRPALLPPFRMWLILTLKGNSWPE